METNGSSKVYAGDYAVECFLTPVMENYMYGKMTEEEFCTAVKQYYDTHIISVSYNDELKMVTEKLLPELIEKMEAMAVSSGSAEEDQKKKIEAWILFKDCLNLLEERPPFSEEREEYLTTGLARADEVEYSDPYLLIERELETLVREETGEGDYLGYCHLYWSVKKKVLKEKFGIDWRSPSERYPGIIFD